MLGSDSAQLISWATIVDGELDFQLNLDLGPIIYEGRLQDDGSIKGTADLAGMALANFVATKSD